MLSLLDLFRTLGVALLVPLLVVPPYANDFPSSLAHAFTITRRGKKTLHKNSSGAGVGGKNSVCSQAEQDRRDCDELEVIYAKANHEDLPPEFRTPETKKMSREEFYAFMEQRVQQWSGEISQESGSFPSGDANGGTEDHAEESLLFRSKLNAVAERLRQTTLIRESLAKLHWAAVTRERYLLRCRVPGGGHWKGSGSAGGAPDQGHVAAAEAMAALRPEIEGLIVQCLELCAQLRERRTGLRKRWKAVELLGISLEQAPASQAKDGDEVVQLAEVDEDSSAEEEVGDYDGANSFVESQLASMKKWKEKAKSFVEIEQLLEDRESEREALIKLKRTSKKTATADADRQIAGLVNEINRLSMLPAVVAIFFPGTGGSSTHLQNETVSTIIKRCEAVLEKHLDHTKRVQAEREQRLARTRAKRRDQRALSSAWTNETKQKRNLVGDVKQRLTAFLTRFAAPEKEVLINFGVFPFLITTTVFVFCSPDPKHEDDRLHDDLYLLVLGHMQEPFADEKRGHSQFAGTRSDLQSELAKARTGGRGLVVNTGLWDVSRKQAFQNLAGKNAFAARAKGSGQGSKSRGGKTKKSLEDPHFSNPRESEKTLHDTMSNIHAFVYLGKRSSFASSDLREQISDAICDRVLDRRRYQVLTTICKHCQSRLAQGFGATANCGLCTAAGAVSGKAAWKRGIASSRGMGGTTSREEVSTDTGATPSPWTELLVDFEQIEPLYARGWGWMLRDIPLPEHLTKTKEMAAMPVVTGGIPARRDDGSPTFANSTELFADIDDPELREALRLTVEDSEDRSGRRATSGETHNTRFTGSRHSLSERQRYGVEKRAELARSAVAEWTVRGSLHAPNRMFYHRPCRETKMFVFDFSKAVVRPMWDFGEEFVERAPHLYPDPFLSLGDLDQGRNPSLPGSRALFNIGRVGWYVAESSGKKHAEWKGELLRTPTELVENGFSKKNLGVTVPAVDDTCWMQGSFVEKMVEPLLEQMSSEKHLMRSLLLHGRASLLEEKGSGATIAIPTERWSVFPMEQILDSRVWGEKAGVLTLSNVAPPPSSGGGGTSTTSVHPPPHDSSGVVSTTTLSWVQDLSPADIVALAKRLNSVRGQRIAGEWEERRFDPRSRTVGGGASSWVGEIGADVVIGPAFFVPAEDIVSSSFATTKNAAPSPRVSGEKMVQQELEEAGGDAEEAPLPPAPFEWAANAEKDDGEREPPPPEPFEWSDDIIGLSEAVDRGSTL